MAMHIDTSSIAYFAIGACVAGILWAVFWPGQRRRDKTRPSNHWELIYVDEDGVLLFTLIRVLHIDTDARRLTAWCSRSGRQRVFKFSKIVKATDVQTGARVHLSHGLADQAPAASRSRVGARDGRDREATPHRRRSDHVSHRDTVWHGGLIGMLTWGHGQAHNR
jgi:hypothetical protein